MNSSTYWSIIGSMALSIVFIKIYKHNRLVKKSYQLQALQEKKQKLTNKRNDLLTQLHNLKNPSTVKAYVEKKLCFKPLCRSQVLSLRDIMKESA